MTQIIDALREELQHYETRIVYNIIGTASLLIIQDTKKSHITCRLTICQQEIHLLRTYILYGPPAITNSLRPTRYDLNDPTSIDHLILAIATYLNRQIDPTSTYLLP